MNRAKKPRFRKNVHFDISDLNLWLLSLGFSFLCFKYLSYSSKAHCQIHINLILLGQVHDEHMSVSKYFKAENTSLQGYTLSNPFQGIASTILKEMDSIGGLTALLPDLLWKCEVKVKVAQSCLTLYSPWNSPGQNTGVGRLSLLQGIFPTQGLNAGLPHCRRILYQLSHKVSPRILEWVTYPFASISSQPRNRNRVSCIAGRFLTNWANIKPKMSLIQSQEVNNVQCKRALLKLPVLGLPVHS